jgi:hypothetical protein
MAVPLAKRDDPGPYLRSVGKQMLDWSQEATRIGFSIDVTSYAMQAQTHLHLFFKLRPTPPQLIENIATQILETILR